MGSRPIAGRPRRCLPTCRPPVADGLTLRNTYSEKNPAAQVRSPGLFFRSGPAAGPWTSLRAACLRADLERPPAPADDIAVRVIDRLTGPVAAGRVQRGAVARIDHIAPRLGGAHDGGTGNAADDQPGQKA